MNTSPVITHLDTVHELYQIINGTKLFQTQLSSTGPRLLQTYLNYLYLFKKRIHRLGGPTFGV